MIQVLTYWGTEEAYKGKNCVVRKIHDAESLDAFDINVIILNDRHIWENNDANHNTVNCIRDLSSIATMIDKSKKSKNLIMFDDEKQQEIIQKNLNIIQEQNDVIAQANDVLEKNTRYKSILYTNGDALVEVVFDILQEMLGCDLSQFEDVKKEDFCFEIQGTTFIGEIKGVNHNVKNENISQLDVHYQSYFDEHEDASQNDVKALLVMNHQKNKPIAGREEVHEQQIKLAERNGSLIIETPVLLKLFEEYLLGNKTREECISLLRESQGLLKL